MLNNDVKTTLDNIVQAVDTKIDKRLDAMEIAAKKSDFNTNSSFNFKNQLLKGLKKNVGQREFEIKADELFISEINSGTMVPAAYETNIKNEPFENDLRVFFPQGSTDSDTVTVNRGVYATNSAAITTEATQFPESTNTLDAVSFSIDKLAHRFSLSEEFLGIYLEQVSLLQAKFKADLLRK